jgi:hypothetical protein
MRSGPTLALAVCLLGGPLSGCADLAPFDPPVAGEMKPGPGLFSGPDGAFVILRREVPQPSGEASQAPSRPAERDLTRPPPP